SSYTNNRSNSMAAPTAFATAVRLSLRWHGQPNCLLMETRTFRTWLRRLHSALSAIIHSPTATSGYRFSLAYYSYANGCDVGRGDYHQRWFDLAADKGTESELAAWFRERIVRL